MLFILQLIIAMILIKLELKRIFVNSTSATSYCNWRRRTVNLSFKRYYEVETSFNKPDL